MQTPRASISSCLRPGRSHSPQAEGTWSWQSTRGREIMGSKASSRGLASTGPRAQSLPAPTTACPKCIGSSSASHRVTRRPRKPRPHAPQTPRTHARVTPYHLLGLRSLPVSPSLRRAGNIQSGWKGDPVVAQVVPLLLMGDTFERAAALGRLNWRPDVIYANPPRGRGFAGDLTAAYELLKCGGLLAGHGYHLDQVHKPLATFSRKVFGHTAQPRGSYAHNTFLTATLLPSASQHNVEPTIAVVAAASSKFERLDTKDNFDNLVRSLIGLKHSNFSAWWLEKRCTS